MQRATFHLFFLAILTASGQGCFKRSPPAVYDPAAPIFLVVRNNSRQDVTVQVSGEGGRRRLGNVVASTAESYTLTAVFLGGSRELNLVAEAIGSRDAARTRVTALPGQEVVWTLEAVLSRSYVSVR
jgi:hypothetical protein